MVNKSYDRQRQALPYIVTGDVAAFLETGTLAVSADLWFRGERELAVRRSEFAKKASKGSAAVAFKVNYLVTLLHRTWTLWGDPTQLPSVLSQICFPVIVSPLQLPPVF